MDGVSGSNSLTYNCCSGLRSSVGGGSGPLGLSCLSPTQGICVRFRYTSDRCGPTAGRPHGARIRDRESEKCAFWYEAGERGRARGTRAASAWRSGRDDGRAWWVTKTGDTLDWPGCRAFLRFEERPGDCVGRAGR